MVPIALEVIQGLIDKDHARPANLQLSRKDVPLVLDLRVCRWRAFISRGCSAMGKDCVLSDRIE